ncbi:MAG: zinc ribbon domain-containing protein [Anaerolineales bacterium]|nr:zinc ribbon domain-containing protein [Anaerolineales bacterium]
MVHRRRRQEREEKKQQVETGSKLDDLIETAVRVKRGRTNQPVTCQHCQEQLGPDDNFCPQCGRMAGVNCPVCQQAGTPGDNFCTGCGTSLKDVLQFAGR